MVVVVGLVHNMWVFECGMVGASLLCLHLYCACMHVCADTVAGA
jgi:hypothetical protein